MLPAKFTRKALGVFERQRNSKGYYNWCQDAKSIFFRWNISYPLPGERIFFVIHSENNCWMNKARQAQHSSRVVNLVVVPSIAAQTLQIQPVSNSQIVMTANMLSLILTRRASGSQIFIPASP